LLAPALKALTQLLIENMTLTKFFGLAEVDSLLSEFILDDINGQSTPSVSIKEQLVSPSHLPSAASSGHSLLSAPSSIANDPQMTDAGAGVSSGRCNFLDTL